VSCGLRDVLEFETLDTPAVLVASDAFTGAAEDQSANLGQPAIRRVFVPHPVQNRTDDELRAAARIALDEVLARLGKAEAG
jgi:hypothetical protein